MSLMQAIHIPTEAGPRFAILHLPPAAVTGLVVHVHAFAEEMNKARRAVAEQARAFAAAGFVVLVPDLHGCGNSEGDFGDATWEGWVNDIVDATGWLQAQYTQVPRTWLWGLRAGCLLAAQAAARLPRQPDLLFWQPAPSGKVLLQQFLRLKVAANLQSGDSTGITRTLRTDLAAGRSVEVAGYMLSSSLANGLETAELMPTLPAKGAGRLVWLEITSREPVALLPASAATSDGWRQAGFEVSARAVAGPAFWQTQEIEVAPALQAASTAHVLGSS